MFFHLSIIEITNLAQILIHHDVSCLYCEIPGQRKEIFIRGISLDGDSKAIYVLQAEEMVLCYPGILRNSLSAEVIKAIGDVDILFVPVGEEESLKLDKTQKLISDIDPRVVIPMLYSDIESFKIAEGIKDGEVETLKIKKADLPEGKRKFFILKRG